MAKQTFTTGQVLTAAQVNSLQANDFNQTVSVKTAAYVLAAADKGTRIEFNTSGAVTCTVNSGLFDAGDTLIIQNRGAGAVTVTAGTATVNTSASLVVSQYGQGILYFVSDSSSIFFAGAPGDITGITTGANSGLTGGVTSGDADLKLNFTAKGQLAVGTGSGTTGFLTVGTNGHTIVADSTETTGIKWAAPAGGSLPAAKARQTVVQSISNNTWTKVTYTTEDYDTGSDFASSTFTCDTAGYYSINASVNFDSGTAIDYPRIRIYKNGANENETGINKQEYPLLTINTVVYLAVNDTVEIYIYQDSGTSKNTGNGNRSMWFAITGIRS